MTEVKLGKYKRNAQNKTLPFGWGYVIGEGTVELGRDDKTIIMFFNNEVEPKKVTIHHKGEVEKPSSKDLNIIVEQSTAGAISVVLDSERFLCEKGENKGKIVISAEGQILVASIELP